MVQTPSCGKQFLSNSLDKNDLNFRWNFWMVPTISAKVWIFIFFTYRYIDFYFVTNCLQVIITSIYAVKAAEFSTVKYQKLKMHLHRSKRPYAIIFRCFKLIFKAFFNNQTELTEPRKQLFPHLNTLCIAGLTKTGTHMFRI